MKKIFLLLILFAFLYSCSKNSSQNEQENINSTGSVDNIQENNTSSGNLQNESGTGETVDVNQEELPQEVIDELTNVTRDNFDPILVFLKDETSENIINYNCGEYFFLPNSESRPEFQLDIQQEYISECEKLKNTARIDFYNSEIQKNPEEIFVLKDSYQEEYEEFSNYIRGLDYQDFLSEIREIGIDVEVSEEEFLDLAIEVVSFEEYYQAIENNIMQKREEFSQKQNEYREWLEQNNTNN